jgi:NADPH:quinone reductase-like Zn-dependent oxidoreductase
MKAAVYTEFGPPEVLSVTDVLAPVPRENEVLVRVHATSVGYGDILARKFRDITGREFHMPLLLLFVSRLVFGFSKPRIRILGSEFSGVVEAVGNLVTRYQPGNQVYGFLSQRMGAYAGYVCLPENGVLAMKPANISHEEAATVPYGAVMATDLLQCAQIKPGQKVLINGASGGIGSAAVQLAKIQGAEVTGVCGAERMEYVKALGADHVIDYSRQDFTANGVVYDLILDVLGKSSYARVRNSLAPNGIYLLASFKAKAILQMLWTGIAGRQKVICVLANEKAENLDYVRQLIEVGRFNAVIDRSYPLEQIVEAHRYVEEGHKKGPVAITVCNNGGLGGR